MATLSELWRLEDEPGRIQVTHDGLGVLLRRLDGATFYPFGPQAPQPVPLYADVRGFERGEVSWAEDYLASTSLEGKVQLLKRQDEGYVVVDVFDHGFSSMPQLSWSSQPSQLLLWQRKEKTMQLWRGNFLEILEEVHPVRGIAWCPTQPLLAVWYCFKGDMENGKSLHLWYTESDKMLEVHVCMDGAQVCDVAWSECTEYCLAAAAQCDGQVVLWSVQLQDSETEEMQLDTVVLRTIPPSSIDIGLDSWHLQWAPGGNGDDVPSFALLPWRHLRLHGAQQSEAVAELHFAVTTEKVEKVLPASCLAAWPTPKIWLHEWKDMVLEGFALTVHGWSPNGRWLLAVADALTPAIGHIKRCRVQLWSMTDGAFVPTVEMSMLEDCPMHRYHFLDDMLLCAAVDGTARLVQMEATSVWKQPYKQLILGETWNAVAPTGSSWRNWPRGATDARKLPCHRIAVTLRHREMAANTEDGDTVVVFGRDFEGSNYRQLLLNRSIEADLPRDAQATRKSLEHFLSTQLASKEVLLLLERVQRGAARFLNTDVVQRMLSEASSAAVAHFTSQVEAAAAWYVVEADRSISHLINDAVQSDDAERLKCLLHFLLSLHACHIAFRSPLLPPPWPEDGIIQLHRVGEALQKSWQGFFRKGCIYRLSHFTTFRMDGSSSEAERATKDGARTEWHLEISERSGGNLLYIDPELCEGSGEWILPPYTVVEVLASTELSDDALINHITLRLPGKPVMSPANLPIGPPM